MRDGNFIGRDTPDEFQRFIENLARFLLDVKAVATGLMLNRIRIVDDERIQEDRSSNFKGDYRCFLVEYKGDKERVGIAVMVNDPDANPGHRTGYSVLVAKKPGEKVNFLQLRLDKPYIHDSGTTTAIRHDGRMGTGARNEEVLRYIRRHAPDLQILKDRNYKDYIQLGTLDNSKFLSWNQEQTRHFIGNLIEYALLRERFKKQFKV